MMKKKKKYIVSIIIFGWLLTFAINSFKEKEFAIYSLVNDILKKENIEQCKILGIGDYADIQYYLVEPNLSQEEIETEIQRITEEMGLSEISNAYVQKKYGCETLKQFYDSVKGNLIENKKIELLVSTRSNVMDRIIEISEFEMNEKEVADFSLEIIYGYEAEAMLYNMSIDEYCNQVLGISYDDFFDKCYEEGEKLIKKYLIVGAIAEIEKDKIKGVQYEEGKDIYYEYQQLENEVYALFIKAEDGF